jgi:hypothetical protein
LSRGRGPEAAGLAADLPERLLVGVEDRRDHERVVRRDGDSDVDALVELEAGIDVGAVRARERAQRERADLDHEVVEGRRLAFAGDRLELRAQRDRLLHAGSGAAAATPTMRAITSPTAATALTGVTMCSTPAASAWMGIAALSVSTSNSSSPMATCCPSSTSHAMIVPDSMPSLSSGIVTSLAVAVSLMRRARSVGRRRRSRNLASRR